MPLAEDLVGDAALAKLVFHFPVLVGPVGRHESVGEHARLPPVVEARDLALVGEVDGLEEIPAVVELVVDVGSACRAEARAFAGEGGVAHRFGHPRRGQQRGDIHRCPATSSARTAPCRASGAAGRKECRSRRGPSGRDCPSLHAYSMARRISGPPSAQPVRVAGLAPVAVGLDERTEMAVGAGTDHVEARCRAAASGGRSARRWATDCSATRSRAASARGPGRGGAGPAGSSRRACRFPRRTPSCVCCPSQAQSSPPSRRIDRGGAQQRQRCRGRVLDRGRQGRSEQGVAEGGGAPLQVVPALQRVAGAGVRVGPLGGVVVGPAAASRVRWTGRRACRGRPSRCRRWESSTR